MVIVTATGVAAVNLWSKHQTESLHYEQLSSMIGHLYQRFLTEWADTAKASASKLLLQPDVYRAVEACDAESLFETLGTIYNYTAPNVALDDWLVLDSNGHVLLSLHNPDRPQPAGPLIVNGKPITSIQTTELIVGDGNSHDEARSICLVIPVHNRQGTLAGWMCLVADVHVLVSRFRSLIGQAIVIEFPNGVRLSDTPQDEQVITSLDPRSTSVQQLPETNQYFYLYTYTLASGISVKAAYDVSEKSISQSRNQFIAFSFTAILVVTCLVLGLSSLKRRLRPIRMLNDVMKQVRTTGKYNVTVPINRYDEIGQLSETFNAMGHQMADHIRDLEKARSIAETAAQSKSEFLANMSHEIRTPMTAILGFTDLLMDSGHSPADAHSTINTIRRNGEHLLTIINDILDMSKIESGKMAVEKISCSPHQILFDAASLMRVRAHDKGLKLGIECLGPIPNTIQSDPTRLRQILINLLGNAIKFTESGGIRVTVKMGDDPRSVNPHLRFEVIDTGIGMTEKQIDRLFKPFTQADSSTTRKFGGTGLGLTISKVFTELLGGHISVKSTPGESTSFVVTIATGPLDGVEMVEKSIDSIVHELEKDNETVEDTSRKSLDKTRILLAEDGPDNQRLISFHLKKWGALVTLANNGQIAMGKALEAWRDDKPFDVILMDMQMPVMDGYAAVTQLRKEGYKGPIIALTAHAMDSDRQKCIDAGCDDFATKPINKAEMLATIQQHLSSHTARAA